MQYTGRVLVGFWFDKLQLETEIREKLERKRAEGRLPHQRVERLVQAYGQPVPLAREASVFLEYKQRLQLTCPEILDQTYRFEGRRGCPDEDLESKNPKRYGLFLAATVSPEEIDAGLDGIEDGCPLACTPRREAVARSVFLLSKAADDGQEKEEECLRFGEEFYLQLAHASERLYLRSEPPLLDGRFGPRDHNPLRLSVSRDCYAKWRAAHSNPRRRFETDRQPVPACIRLLVIQHVMTGQCLAAEDLVWHRSLLGFECGASVHTYSDVHRDEGPECIWSFVPSSKYESPDRECTNVA
ncbi:uncharacterized protein LOC100120726 isoform X1 [Nasonia vitripennis]|uniref:Uncharacterized protein n=1 Tax=Nasonia vitripennis TaxID=7425 RepID=A0A7M7HHQ3_NASVI|nr:uncharacterized protein LOC100120726 isoform X1 [Nasonia vitripennis]